MKVLMTADPIGGVWSYALELCAALARHDVSVSLATLGGKPSGFQLEQLARLSNVTLFPSTYRLEWMPQPWDDLRRAGEWLLSLQQAVRPDLVHLNHLVHADLPWHAPVLTVAHSCVLSWWSAVRGTPLPAEWMEYRSRVTRSLRQAQCVAAPTRAILTEVEAHYGPLRRGIVIHNARDGRPYAARWPKESLILCAGRIWDPAKNIEALAAVAPAVRAPIIVAGDVRDPADTAQEPVHQGSERQLSRLTLVGPLSAERLAEYYGRAAVYALPARYEPFGLTALEAALSGCALVLGDIPTLREVWGNAACYVHPDDHVGLRDKLNELLVDHALRSELAARAEARASSFSPGRFARRYLSVYRALCSHRASDAGRRRPIDVNGPAQTRAAMHPT
jgi:glycogen synthase